MGTQARLSVVDPARGEVLREVRCDARPDWEAKFTRGHEAQKRWRALPLHQRVEQVRAALDYFRRERESVARDVTLEMGKPIAQARRECDTLLQRAEHMLTIAPGSLAAEELPSASGAALRIDHEPVGLVLDISPWNYPLLVPGNVIVPALVAGNAVVLKHSPKSPSAGAHFERAFASLSEPDVFANVVVADFEASALIADPRVDYVAFTGSVPTGRRVYELAAQRLIDVGLELGGKDPAYVAEDADLDFAAENIVDGACYNAGQSCCAVERAYVHERVYQAFLERAKKAMASLRLGSPLDEATTLGPLVDRAALERVEAQVRDALARGARLLHGGRRAPGLAGFFYEPTLLADCPDEAEVMREETFGPVLPVRAVASDAEALLRMNDSRFGLTASVWTQSSARADHFARELEAGTVYQNRCDFLDPSLPWTGCKESGIGSTLSRYGYLHLTRRKSVYLRRG